MAHQFTSSGEPEREIRARDELMANLCHDLRTPLNIIIGFAELMLDEVPGPVNANQRQCLNDILNGGKRLLELLNPILDMSRIDANDGPDTAGKKTSGS